MTPSVGPVTPFINEPVPRRLPRVTANGDGNTPALALYAAVGFRPINGLALLSLTLPPRQG